MLTVAAPSVAVMGVAAAAASSVAAGHSPAGIRLTDGLLRRTPDEGGATASPIPAPRAGQELARAERRAADAAARASHERISLELKQRQAEEARRRAVAAARRETLRAKFVLPVAQRGLSAYFGQSGINWMSIHTGIDFPVSQGTPVRATTDGTVRTLWNPWYGNMAIVTAPDGTQTLYCHLSGTRVRSGSVRAGTVIAYSGNTGNTTGPHLHFEVRPGGGQPIDPLPWLLSHGLDPR